MLSTIDNPFNPFENFNAWYSFDVASGYHSSAYLARILQSSDDLSEADEDLAIEQAIDSIVSENISGVFIKVTRE